MNSSNATMNHYSFNRNWNKLQTTQKKTSGPPSSTHVDTNKRQTQTPITQTDRSNNPCTLIYPTPVALDCEMVGLGKNGYFNALARASIVDESGKVLLDIYVKQSRVVDYRYRITGLTQEHLKNGLKFENARKKILEILEDKIVVGHGLENDFRVLNYRHPLTLIRDTSHYKPFRTAKSVIPSLRSLADRWLSATIHTGHHDSVVDAQTAMRLYLLFKEKWEQMYISVIGPYITFVNREESNEQQIIPTVREEAFIEDIGEVVEENGVELEAVDGRLDEGRVVLEQHRVNDSVKGGSQSKVKSKRKKKAAIIRK